MSIKPTNDDNSQIKPALPNEASKPAVTLSTAVSTTMKKADKASRAKLSEDPVGEEMFLLTSRGAQLRSRIHKLRKEFAPIRAMVEEEKEILKTTMNADGAVDAKELQKSVDRLKKTIKHLTNLPLLISGNIDKTNLSTEEKNELKEELQELEKIKKYIESELPKIEAMGKK